MRHRLLASLILLSFLAPACDARKSSAPGADLETSPIKEIAPISPITSIKPISPINSSAKSVERNSSESLADKQQKKQKLARAAQSIIINAPQEVVYQTLENFDSYPVMFNKRIKSCQVTRRDANLVYIETQLKPQLFVKQTCQHTVNDMSMKPAQLNWHQLDGNFNYIEGCWSIKQLSGNRCELTYSIGVDAGPVVPSGLVSWILKGVEKEIVAQVKTFTEHEYRQQLKASAQGEQRQPHN